MPDTNRSFRCPFEIKGRKENTILEASLDQETRDSRLEIISSTLKNFLNDPTKVGVKFLLPSSLLENCSSFFKLQALIFPYLVEVTAAELDYRLFPLLPYQIKLEHEQMVMEIFHNNSAMAPTITGLTNLINSSNFKPVAKIGDLADWLEMVLKNIQHSGQNPDFTIHAKSVQGPSVPILKVGLGGADMYVHGKDITNEKRNKNTFNLVKCPFYQKETGRYSENLEIWITKEAHYSSVPEDIRKAIRKNSNSVLNQFGEEIENLEDEKQTGGLWFPKWVRKLIGR